MYKFFSTIMLVVMLAFLGCGSSSDGVGSSSSDGGGDNNGGNVVVIDTKQKAINAFVVIGNFVDSTNDIDVSGDSPLAINFPASKSRELIDINNKNCTISGTMSMTGETGGVSTPMDITTSFVQCKNVDNITQNGSMHISGTEDNIQIVFTNYSIVDANDTQTMDLTVHVQGSDDNRTITMSGTITSPEGSASLTNYTINFNEIDNSLTLNGTIMVTRIPSSCADGTYVMETIQPLVEDPVTEDIISGQIKINNVLFTFQSDGTAIATINGQEITIDTNQSEIVCN